MAEKVYCSECAAAEFEYKNGFGKLIGYLCHRKSGNPVRVSLGNWCYEGIKLYGDKGVDDDT